MRLLLIGALAACIPPPVHHVAANCMSADETKRHTRVMLGRWFDSVRVDEMIPGDSTVDDARCLFGRPENRSVIGDQLVLGWTYSQIVPGRAHTESLSISFDGDGRMLRVVILASSGDPIE